MARFCEGCGHPLGDTVSFCDKCGRKTQGRMIATPPPAAPAGQYRRAVPAQPQKKSGAGMFLGFGLGAVVMAVLGILLIGGVVAVIAFSNPSPTATQTTGSPTLPKSGVQLLAFPDELKIDTTNIKVNCSYRAPDTIIPANYRSLDYVVYMQCWTDRGRTKLQVTVEIPGFTQKYQQMIDVSRSETELTIHPPLLEGVTKTLDASKDAQLLVTVMDMESGKIWLQDTKPVKLWSFYDMKWEDEDGTPYFENILAWVTPEAKEVDKLIYDSGAACNDLTGGYINTIVGYQGNGGELSEAQITAAQVCSMMYTLANTYNVKYSNNSFSSTSSSVQSVATPAKVINNAAGLCIETAVTMASAIQRTNMHAVIILLPGHAQVAVETWNGSGEYLLIETTALEAARVGEFKDVLFDYTKDQWKQFLSQEGVVAIDCALAEPLKIMPIE